MPLGTAAVAKPSPVHKWFAALRPWQRAALGFSAIVAVIFIVALIGVFRDAIADRDASAVAVIGTVEVDHILGPRDFDALGGAIGPDLGISGAPAVVLMAGGLLRAVDHLDSSRPRIREIDIAGHQPKSFALDQNGAMLAVADGYFGVLNQDGQIVDGVPLPFSNMRLAPSSHVGAVYLFGGAQKDYRLYRFIDDGTLQILLETDVPIIAAADNEQSIYAATASTILQIKAGTPDVLFKAPEDFAGPIRSLAVTADGVILFSTDAKVYALLGPNALSIVNNAGGTLRVRNGSLYVLDRQRKILFSLHPASAHLISEIRQ